LYHFENILGVGMHLCKVHNKLFSFLQGVALPIVTWNVESLLRSLPIFPRWYLYPANQPRLCSQPGM